MRVNKGQVLIVTLFILTSSMIVTFMLLVPVVSQSLKVRALLNGFQALANAERGIEIGNYYALKGVELVRDTGCPGCVTISHSASHCDEFTTGPFEKCIEKTMGDGSNFQSHIDVALSQREPIEIKSSRNISQGVYRGVSRILQFIFTPQQN